MMNFSASSENSFAFFKEVLQKKHNTNNDVGYKNRVMALYPNIEPLHESYDNHFTKDNLQNLTAFGYKNQEKEDLQKLYKYGSLKIQMLKQSIITTPSHRIISTCQNCTINSVDSMDHVLPQSEFSEFIVHPKNLFPSCTECNRIKNNVFSQGGQRQFLNLYLDILPLVQYLFVNIESSSAGVYPTFYLENSNGINPDFFQLISSHYNRLGLLEKFSFNSDGVIINLINNLKPSLSSCSRSDLISKGKESARLNQNSFGLNYWKSILEISLLDSDLFWAIVNSV